MNLPVNVSHRSLLERNSDYSSFCALQEKDKAPPSKKLRKDKEFNAVGEDSTDDETTIAEQEAHEKAKAEDGSSEDEDNGPSAGEVKEVSQLASEAEIPIEELLARYGIDSDQLKKQVAVDGDSRETSETASATDNEPGFGESSSDNESPSSEEEDSGDSSSEKVNENEDVEMEELGLEDLLSEDEKENLANSNNSIPEVSLIFSFINLKPECILLNLHFFPVECRIEGYYRRSNECSTNRKYPCFCGRAG